MAALEAQVASHAQRADVEDQAPLLVASSRPTSRIWRWRGLAVAAVGIFAFAVVATAGVRTAVATSQGSTSPALTGLDEVKPKKADAPAEGKKDNKDEDAAAVEAALKEGKIDMAYLQGVKKGLAMHHFDTTGKDDKTMSVKKGEVVYLESKKKEDAGEQKEGWIWTYKMSGESGFVPRETLNLDFKDCVNSFKPTGEKADKQLEVKAGEPVWVQHEDKEWVLVYKPGKEGEILSGFIPQWSLHATKEAPTKKADGKKETKGEEASEKEKKDDTKKEE